MLLVLLAETRLVEFLRHAVGVAVADRPPFALTGRYIVVAGDYRSISFNFGLVASQAGKFFDVAVFAIDVLFLLVVRPGRSLCRCTIVLSFFNEEQMLAAWLSDWAPSLARVTCMLPSRRTSPGTHDTINMNGWKSQHGSPIPPLLLKNSSVALAQKKNGQPRIAGLSLRQNQNCIHVRLLP